MTRTWYQPEKLRGGVDKIENLRDEQEQQGFTEVAQDSDNGKDHAGEVTVRVADENPCRIPVVSPEGEGDADEGEEKVDAEEVGVCCWVDVFTPPNPGAEIERVVDEK